MRQLSMKASKLCPCYLFTVPKDVPDSIEIDFMIFSHTIRYSLSFIFAIKILFALRDN